MTPKLVMGAIALALALVGISRTAMADPQDYEFQLVEPKITQGSDATVAVRLTDKRTGNPVADAVIFATRMDMAPDGMETMTTPVEAMPSTEPGIYNFRTRLVMAGGWRFSIAAKIQGEAETVESKLVIEAIE